MFNFIGRHNRLNLQTIAWTRDNEEFLCMNLATIPMCARSISSIRQSSRAPRLVVFLTGNWHIPSSVAEISFEKKLFRDAGCLHALAEKDCILRSCCCCCFFLQNHTRIPKIISKKWYIHRISERIKTSIPCHYSAVLSMFQITFRIPRPRHIHQSRKFFPKWRHSTSRPNQCLKIMWVQCHIVNSAPNPIQLEKNCSKAMKTIAQTLSQKHTRYDKNWLLNCQLQWFSPQKNH